MLIPLYKLARHTQVDISPFVPNVWSLLSILDPVLDLIDREIGARFLLQLVALMRCLVKCLCLPFNTSVLHVHLGDIRLYENLLRDVWLSSHAFPVLFLQLIVCSLVVTLIVLIVI